MTSLTEHSSLEKKGLFSCNLQLIRRSTTNNTLLDTRALGHGYNAGTAAAPESHPLIFAQHSSTEER